MTKVSLLLQPEDAAKDVNLKPPGFFVASTVSQRQCEGPAGPEVPMPKSGAPPVVIVSYGSSSTPTAANFHHGLYALAQPEAATHVQHVRPTHQGNPSSLKYVVPQHVSILGLSFCCTQPCLLPTLTSMLNCTHERKFHGLTEESTATHRLTQTHVMYVHTVICAEPHNFGSCNWGYRAALA